jgi:flavodoxin
MRAVVGFESMYGNTRKVAEAIGVGLAGSFEVSVLPVGELDPHPDVDLVVVGAPTHGHSLPRPASRTEATRKAAEPGRELLVEPTAEEPGVAEWLDGADLRGTSVAAFDTRMDMNVLLTGRASKGILKRMRRAGASPVAPAESFLVTRATTLKPGEVERARAWGEKLATATTVPGGR